MRFAQLRGVEMRFAQLRGVEMRFAQLRGVEMCFAQLREPFSTFSTAGRAKNHFFMKYE